MPSFEIDQNELHTQTYRIEAANEAEAIKNLFDGHAQPIDDRLEFIEVAPAVRVADRRSKGIGRPSPSVEFECPG